MKLKLSFYGSALFLAIIIASCAQQGKKSAEGESANESVKIPDVSIDVNKSKVLWSGTSLGIYTHTGTVNLSRANLIVDQGEIKGGEFAADLTSIVTTDENYNVEEGYTKEKLVGHLSSADFFDVANHPEAVFTISSYQDGNVYGTLTIRGISKEEQVENIAVVEGAGEVKITGELIFNRKDYDVSWDYSSKDMLLKNEVELKIELVGV